MHPRRWLSALCSRLASSSQPTSYPTTSSTLPNNSAPLNSPAPLNGNPHLPTASNEYTTIMSRQRSSSVSGSVRRLARRLSISSISDVGRSSSRLGRRSVSDGPLPPVPPLPVQEEATAPTAANTCTILIPAVPGAISYKSGARQSSYSVTPLLTGGKVTELWQPSGDTLVYLCSKEEADNFQPAFRLSSNLLKRKSEFFSAALSGRWQQSSGEYVLYFPPWREDDVSTHLQQRLATRNLFAYIVGRPLVALVDSPKAGLWLLDWMARMEMYHLPDLPSSLATYVRSHGLDDPRGSVDRVLDVLLTSERYSWRASFLTSFCHAAGIYETLQHHPSFPLLSAATRQRLEREFYAIRTKISTATSHLARFSFPGLRLRHHRRRGNRQNPIPVPRGWRRAFRALKKITIAYYTSLFRIPSWPPKTFTRGMALQIKKDFDAVYELLVDRSVKRDDSDPYRTLLAREIASYSSSLPQLPRLPPEGSREWGRKQSRDAISVTLMDSYNVVQQENGFLEAFKRVEREYGRGRTVTKSCEAREGRWAFVVAARRTVGGMVEEPEEARIWSWGVEGWLCVDLTGVGWEEDDEVEKREVRSGSGSSAGREKEGSRRGSDTVWTTRKRSIFG